MKIDRTNNYGYNKKLQPIANRLRKNMTKAEACLWKYVLKARKMKGYSFRRQRPVFNYIADFMCKELKLIIEVDGITHQYDETIKHDKKRQKKLEIEGFTLLRFEDSNVLNDINNVHHSIEATIDKLKDQNDLPPPNPRQQGKRSTTNSMPCTPTPRRNELRKCLTFCYPLLLTLQFVLP